MSGDEEPAELKRVPTTDSQYERTKNEWEKELRPAPGEPPGQGG